MKASEAMFTSYIPHQQMDNFCYEYPVDFQKMPPAGYSIAYYPEDFKFNGAGVTLEMPGEGDSGLPMFPVEALLQLPVMEGQEDGHVYQLPLQQKISTDTSTEELSNHES